MHRRPLARLLAAGLLALCVLAPTASVRAVAPESTTEEVSITNAILESCGSFDIIENAVVTLRTTTYFDQNGDPVRDTLKLMYRGTMTNSVTGTSVRDATDAVTVTVDLETGIATVHGIGWSINVPGEGIVVLEAGTLIIYPDGSAVVHGPHQIFEEGQALLCSVLA